MIITNNNISPRIKRKIINSSPQELMQYLHPIPYRWKWVVLGELDIDISDGNYAGKYPKASDFIKTGVPFICATNIGDNFLIIPDDLRYISEKLHDELQRGHLLRNDILIVTRGQIGKVAIVSESFENCNINAQLVRVNTGNIFIPKFFMYALASDFGQKQFSKLKTGSTLNQLPIGKLRQLCIPLPPLPEQERIVERIESLFTQLDAGVAGLKHLKAALQRYKVSVLKAACEGRLVPQDPNDEPAEEILKRLGKTPLVGDDLPKIPQGWCRTKLENITETIGGITKGRNLVDKSIVTLPYLRVANVQRGWLDLSEMKEIDVLVSEFEKYHLHDGDLVLTEGGDWDKLGRAAIWKNQISDCVHQNHIFRARLKSSKILVEWLMYYINSELGQAYFKDASKQTTNLASINLTQLRACQIPLPPFAEQHRIVAEIERLLSVVQEFEQTIEANLKRASHLRQAILKRAFEGKLLSNHLDDAFVLQKKMGNTKPEQPRLF